MKKYYIDNKERTLEQRKQYNKQRYIDNRDNILIKNKRWKLDNKEKRIVRGKQYYIENRIKVLEWHRQNRINNKENIIKQRRKYEHTEAGKATRQRTKSKRRATEKNIINTLTAQEWIDILKKYKFRCAYCGKEFTLFDRPEKDHAIPISKGGNNTKENIVPSCRSCNAKKSNNNGFVKGCNWAYYNRDKK